MFVCLNLLVIFRIISLSEPYRIWGIYIYFFGSVICWKELKISVLL
jgi:hypothetical protein